MDGAGTVRVTPVYRDTLTWGCIGVKVHGWSRDCQSNCVYGDTLTYGRGGGGYRSGNPQLVRELSE